MFLQEPNIDRNYVPGKIRNTWRISMLQYVLVCHPGPAQIRRETRFTFNGHRICIIVKWGTQLWIIWNDIDEKISIDFNVYEEKMHSQSFFKTNSMDCALAALLEMRLLSSNYTKKPDFKSSIINFESLFLNNSNYQPLEKKSSNLLAFDPLK